MIWYLLIICDSIRTNIINIITCYYLLFPGMLSSTAKHSLPHGPLMCKIRRSAPSSLAHATQPWPPPVLLPLLPLPPTTTTTSSSHVVYYAIPSSPSVLLSLSISTSPSLSFCFTSELSFIISRQILLSFILSFHCSTNSNKSQSNCLAREPTSNSILRHFRSITHITL